MTRKYSKEDILRIAEEENVEFIRLQFTDVFGNLKNIAITDDHLKDALNNKCMFDGSSGSGHNGDIPLEAPAWKGCKTYL